jgi:hypothetical protein
MDQPALRLPTLVEASFPPGKFWSSALAHFSPDNSFLVSRGPSIWHVSADFKQSHWAGSLSGKGSVRDGHRLNEATFIDPTGIVVVGTDVYIIDRTDNTIRKVSGDQVTTYACAEQPKRNPKVFVELSSPHHAVEHNGLLYVSNSGKNNIVVINLLENCLEAIIGVSTPTPSMKTLPSGAWAPCTFDYPIGLAVNRSNNSIYVADQGNTIRELLLADKKPGRVLKTSLNWVHGITCLDNGDIIACAYVNSFLALFPHRSVPGVPYLKLSGLIRPVSVCTTSSGDLAWLSEKHTLYVTRNLTCLNESAPSIRQNLILSSFSRLFPYKLLRPSISLSNATESSSTSLSSEMEDIITLFIKDQFKNPMENQKSFEHFLMGSGCALHGLLSPYSEEITEISLIPTVFDSLSHYRAELKWKMMAPAPAPLFSWIPPPTHPLPMNFKLHLVEMNVFFLLFSENLIESTIEEWKSDPQISKELFSFTESNASKCRLLALGPYICELNAQKEMTMLYRSDMAIKCLKKVQGQFLFTNQYYISSFDIKDRRSKIYAGSGRSWRTDGHRLTHARFEEIHQFVELKSKLFISENSSVLRILDLGSDMVSSIKCGFDIYDWQMGTIFVPGTPSTKKPQELIQQNPFQPCYLGLSPSEDVLYVGDRPYGGQIRLFHTKSGVLSDPIVPEELKLLPQDVSSPVGIGNGLILTLHPLSGKISLINSINGSQKDNITLDALYLSMEVGESELVLASPLAISVMSSLDLGLNLKRRYMYPSFDTGPDWKFLEMRIQSLDVRTRVSLAVSGFFTKAPTQFFRALNLCNDKNILTEQDRYEIPTLIRLLFALASNSPHISPCELLRFPEFEGYYIRGFHLCSIHEKIAPYYMYCYEPYLKAESPAFEACANGSNLQFLAPSDMPSYDTDLSGQYKLTLPQAIRAIGHNLKLRPRYNTAFYSSLTPLPSSLPTFPVSFHDIPPTYVIDVHTGILTPQWPWFATFVQEATNDRFKSLPLGFSVHLFITIASAMYGNTLVQDDLLHGCRVFIKANPSLFEPPTGDVPIEDLRVLSLLRTALL